MTTGQSNQFCKIGTNRGLASALCDKGDIHTIQWYKCPVQTGIILLRSSLNSNQFCMHEKYFTRINNESFQKLSSKCDGYIKPTQDDIESLKSFLT